MKRHRRCYLSFMLNDGSRAVWPRTFATASEAWAFMGFVRAQRLSSLLPDGRWIVSAHVLSAPSRKV